MKLFEEYIEDGVVKVQSPDFSRAKSLKKEAETSYKVLKEIIKTIGITSTNSNYIIKNAYDIIMELIRARMLKEGFNSVGKGAHEAEVVYLKKIGFKDSEIDFADQLRYFRNGILYYGKTFDEEYAHKVIDFLEKVYLVLTEN
ncbi:hypothetical protein HOD05_05145 [Candidatus Woesearchaeota archaeon]|jgi:hypothetical protein|nr:hypothetical protein [Candidatus Woesearchaeota archaeon]MBT4151098.1 hypothetical protein [Candidatus Woesearchaeota archaeon]MBT4434572.1 hypothetical protein [Candidatus Woesearchaeota archaeon]MBT7332217.1 hypothetical protein [Candidatus Woesearchaeota archaeon]